MLSKRRRHGQSKSAQRKACDTAFSLWIRSIGICEAAGERFECKGALQCAHILTRGYSVIRWDPKNALSLCQAHHMFWTHRPAQWESFIIWKLGQPHWDELRTLASSPAPVPDYRETLAKIRSWNPRA